MTPWRLVGGCQHFGGTHCLIFRPVLHWTWTQKVPPEPHATLHGVKVQNLKETPSYLLGFEPTTFQPLLSYVADFAEWWFVRSPSACSPPNSWMDWLTGLLFNSLRSNYCVSGHYPSACFYLKHTTLRRVDSVSVFKWNLLSWAQSIGLVPTSRHQHQHSTGYINQAHHKPSARVKTNIKNVKSVPHTWGLAPMPMHYFTAIVVKIRVLSEQKSSLKRQILCMVPT
jgi:hypothetical protein